ncbi:MAG: carboxypeptidase regulatory-like domain-containing protein [Planctomycetales bacterium]|nr:carboxypeptidase regulatory-like domain-containing protein [Planctomycetales bacterium]
MRIHSIQKIAAAIAVASMLLSPAAMANSPLPAAQPADVALADGGVLVGQLVDAQGAPLAGAPVALLAQGREVVRVATNEQGQFRVADVRGGVYQVAAPGYQGVYRMWAPRTAPPTASNGVLAISQGDVVLGQYGPPPGPFSCVMGWVSQHPFMTAGIVATAIAVPLALDDDDPAS